MENYRSYRVDSMSRNKKLFLNLIVSIALQLVTIISGFVLPRLYLQYYGSAVNGLVSSVTQYLGFISLAECGVGAVTQSALYKPLAEKDQLQISKVIISSKKFFRKLGYILIGYVAVLLIIYPKMINDSFEWWFTTSLILAIAISTFAQYYFSMSYRLLLSADQLGYIQMSLQIVTVIVNTILNVFFTINGFSIQIVKLSTSIVFLLQPAGLYLFVKKHYKLNLKLKLNDEPIKQKWNGLAQHISSVVLSRTAVAVLTFYSLVSVSVYNVYFLVVSGLQLIIDSLTNAVQPYIGNIYATQEKNLLNKVFSIWEWISHGFITLLYSCAGILMIPFVRVYTKGITDGNYIVPVFSALITLAYASFCLRYPYTIMIKAAGHYKETQWSCILEAGINIVLSIIFVNIWGLPGVALAILIAMIYRTMYCVFYLERNILYRPRGYYFRNLIVDIIAAVVCIVATSWVRLTSITWIGWIFMALKVAIICILVVLAINSIFYHKMMKEIFIYICNRMKKYRK